MVTFNRILCPVDFSDTSHKALVYAATFAAWYDATIEVAHVAPVFDDDLMPAVAAGSPGESLRLKSRRVLFEELRQFVASAGIARAHQTLIAQQGPVAEAIAELAAEHGVDLLVMGTHGRTGFNHLFLGSVTEKIVRSTACPVLTVPPAARVGLTGPVEFSRILCPIDYSPSSLKALKYALNLGRQADGRVTVLHVLEYMDPMEPPEYVDASILASRRHIIDGARKRLRLALSDEPGASCEVEEVLALNAHRASREIVARAAAGEADLIVMGAQGSKGLELMLYGSSTHDVVRGAGCPVLTVRATATNVM